MSDVAMFANRLQKNIRHWRKWAARQGISCYRVYDRDIPEFPLSIDVYEQAVHLQLYETRWEADEEAWQEWSQGVIQTTAEVMECSTESIFVKQRKRQRGTDQYEKEASTVASFVVTEAGHTFEVNLGNYLDTGLFLDHRKTRAMVGARAAGARFLNLFAYTGSFTVYAAVAGAASSTTVDMSNTYQDWTRRNFVLNNIDQGRHELVRADVFSFLQQANNLARRYDLIVMDPPSFSNSKKMEGVLDIKRDHAGLIDSAMSLLNPGGELFFSSNLRGLKLQEGLFDRYDIHELSKQTVPEDFRNKNIHRSWLFRHDVWSRQKDRTE